MCFISLWPDLNSMAQSEMKTSQFTRREKESERESEEKYSKVGQFVHVFNLVRPG